MEIPANPQRIVCTDFYTTYALLDVGVTPAGTAQATVGGVLPEYQQAYDAIPKVGSPTALNFEAIAAQSPDLILGTLVPSLPADLGTQLSGIGPTLLLPAAANPGSWGERALRTADAVNRLPQGEQLKAATTSTRRGSASSSPPPWGARGGPWCGARPAAGSSATTRRPGAAWCSPTRASGSGSSRRARPAPGAACPTSKGAHLRPDREGPDEQELGAALS